jgi:membrane associated rhomboid family serine protease
MGVDRRDYMQPRDPGVGGWWAISSVSHRLIVPNLVVFILWQLPGLHRFMSDQFTVSWHGLFGELRLWTVLTSAFSHEGLLHLFWNMLGLHWFGPDLEQLYGRRNFLLLYLYGGLVSSLAHVTWERGWGHDVPALGASGAVMAIVVVTAIFYPQRQMWVWVAQLPLWLLATLYLLADFSGLMRGGTGTAHGGHLGGAAAGVFFWWFDLRLFASPGQRESDRPVWPGLLTRLRMAWRWRWRPALARAEAPAPPRASVDYETAARVDELLAKISAGGMASLTPDELEFLKSASGQYRRPT